MANEVIQLTDSDELLKEQSDIRLRMMGGNDYLEVTGGNNYANGNMGEDTIILRGGFGQYLGGKDSDTIKVFGSEEGTSVNGNLGEDYVTGTVAGVTYRGGKGNDLLAVSQGDVWGDKGADTFRAVAGNGFAVIQDYMIGEDMVEIEKVGSWSIEGNGLMFTCDCGDQLMLLLGINDVEQVTRV
jgi:Ca2+-binding RTX toxin-like protein